MSSKRFMIFIDTLGEGLELVPDNELYIFEGEEELKEGVLAVSEYLVGNGDEASYDLEEYELYEKGGLTLAEQIVIVELDDDDTILKRNTFINQTLKEHCKKEKDKDYETYLKLKEKFEGDSK